MAHAQAICVPAAEDRRTELSAPAEKLRFATAVLRLPAQQTCVSLLPSLVLFTYFQVLDVMTTLIGLKAGLSEMSPFIRALMGLGRFEGLILSKCVAFLLAGLCIWSGRKRVIAWINYFYAALVVWNIAFLMAAAR